MLIEFEIKKITDKQAFLINDNKEELILNLDNLPPNSKVKNKVTIAVVSAQSEDQSNQLAKDILNELLSTEK